MKPLNEDQYLRFRRFIYDEFGIFLAEHKLEMLQARLTRLLGFYGLESYDDYYQLLQGREKCDLDRLANAVTVNKTEFFREPKHFDYLREKGAALLALNSATRQARSLRAWSAACSTGEEPYTMAMVLNDSLPQGVEIRVLASDLSTDVLSIAQQGVYPEASKSEIDPYYLQRYFDEGIEGVSVAPKIKDLVTFRQFNLMHPFPFKHRFHIIFCRNVMIYFDADMQQRLIDKFYDVLLPGGLLLIGHSESLMGKRHRFRYVQPSIYVK